MSWPALRAPVPLLTRELFQQAARRRTYIVRTGYAVALFSTFCILTYGVLGQSQFRMARLGMGRGMFHTLVTLQFWGIVLLLPAMMSGTIAGERQNGSLSLLLITSLRPMAVVVQKYMSRLALMATLVLVSLPLLAVSYAFGGISPLYLASGAVTLALACLQVGALAVVCSAYCRTPLGALFSTYALLPVLWIGLGMIFGVVYLVGLPLAALALGGRGDALFPQSAGLRDLCPYPMGLFGLMASGAKTLAWNKVGQIAVSIVLLLVLARRCLVRRAQIAAHGELRRFFIKLDRIANLLGFCPQGARRVARTLPGDEPIAWRQLARSPLSDWRCLYRLFTFLVGPAFFVAVFALIVPKAWGFRVLAVWSDIAWCMAAVCLSMAATSIFAAERAGQTLDVLLTTPISGADIIRQKRHGLDRLLLLFACFLGINVLEGAQLRAGLSAAGPMTYLVHSCGQVVVFLSLATWLGTWVGLRVRPRGRAFLVTIIALLAWNGAPQLLYAMLQVAAGPYADAADWRFVLCASPASLLRLTETLGTPAAGRFLSALAIRWATVAHALVALGLRTLCLWRADAWLGRARGRPRASPLVQATEGAP